MTIDEGTTRKGFSSFNEDQVLESWIGQHVIGALESGSRFFGTLTAFNEHQLLLTGNRGQRIIIKRRRVARLEAV